MNLFQKYLVDEFAEDYQDGHLSRRQALKLIASVTGSLLLANSILAGCAPPQVTPMAGQTEESSSGASPAATSSVSTESPAELNPAEATPTGALEAQDIQFPGTAATLSGYLARPAGDGLFPIVLVCHENRGLTEHIKDVTRRLAQAGYLALAVDLLSRQGGTSSLASDEVPGILGNTPPDQFVSDFSAGWQYLKSLPFVKSERLGMVGFCFGGGVTWLMATRMPELRAAVPFYGPHPPLGDVPNIQAAVLGIYAGNDQRINQGIPAIESAMAEHSKVYEKVIYPGADHAFHNDTGSRYNPEAAQDAWQRTLEWFARYL